MDGHAQSAAPTEFISTSLDDAKAAWRRQGGGERWYRLGTLTACVRYADRDLDSLLSPGLAHAMVDPGRDADVTVYAVDASQGGMPPPPHEWPFDLDTADHIQRTHCDAERGFYLASDETRGIWNLFDGRSRQGAYWVRDRMSLPDWEAGAPLRLHLHWVAMIAGYQLVHGAVFGTERAAICLTGRGGSGKSTTTAAAIVQGATTVGDDFVLMRANDPSRAWSLYDCVKPTNQSLAWWPKLNRSVVNPERGPDDKARIHLKQHAPDQFVGSLPVRCIACCQIAGSSRTEIEPCAPGEVMRALAPSSMFLLRTHLKQSFANLSSLVHALPTYRVRLGRDPQEAAAALMRFLDTCRHP